MLFTILRWRWWKLVCSWVGMWCSHVLHRHVNHTLTSLQRRLILCASTPTVQKEKNFHGQFKAMLVEKHPHGVPLFAWHSIGMFFSPAWLWIGHENSPLHGWGRSAEISLQGSESIRKTIQVQYKVQSSKRSKFKKFVLTWAVYRTQYRGADGRLKEWTNCTTPRPSSFL